MFKRLVVTAGSTVALGLTLLRPGAAEPFVVATYNLENYLVQTTDTRAAKSDLARMRVRQAIRGVNADILALQEVGGTNALLELRSSLKKEGLDYPHWELVTGVDTNIQVAILSRLPITARHPHPKENFLLNGRRFQVSRGFAEVVVQAGKRYAFTLITAHLKSRRASVDADEADLREQEALRLREIIDARLKENPSVNLVVLGDFNDTKDSKSTRVLLGRGKSALIDVRPTERNGDTEPNPIPRFEPRHIAWTHYYGKEDTYSRIDYILLSPGMARELKPDGTYVFTMPNWGSASDHRPVVATFASEDR